MKKIFFPLFLLLCQLSYAQKISKADKKVIASLKLHINYLADDKLEGRRTGSAGEKLAYEYIIEQFKNANIPPVPKNENYTQEFEVNDGKEIADNTSFIVNTNSLILNEDFFPLAYSANGSTTCDVYLSLKERGEVWFFDLHDLLSKNTNNPHFDLQDAIIKLSDNYAKKGATALVIYNSSQIEDGLKFNSKDKTALTKIPVIYLSKNAKKKYLADEIGMNSLSLNINIEIKSRTGHNVIGYINNNSATTVVLGAHYDHLGYGQDHNTLYTGKEPMIHNGADDNASGTAAMIELGKMLHASKLKKNNYLLIAFSGEELGLFGSKYFTENPLISLSDVNYMINMDMVGRLNDSTHGLTIGGFGTSPSWNKVIDRADKYFKFNLDSSGTGPSDHTSFYRKDIPVLFFFTGTHTDYHKPADDAEKINYTGELSVIKLIYNVIRSSDKLGKFTFTKTREAASAGKTSFKVSMGIMPDYTFNGNGVHVDGVTEGRAAEKAGLKTGDVIIQLGDYKVSDVQTYMEALNKFNKGDATTVKLKRGKDELILDLVF